MRRYSLVQSVKGKPIYPMREEKALSLLQAGDAILLCENPMTIRLNYTRKKRGRYEKKRYIVALEIAGNSAMWTRPDTGDSPISEIVPSYSAVEGIFKSILWGPAIEIIPIKTEICKPIQYQDYWTNYGGPLRKKELIKDGNQYQHKATILVDVCYRLYAEAISCPDKSKFDQMAISWDAATTNASHAYQEIFNRRLEKGQCYHVPFLGWKECTPSYFGEFRPETEVENKLPDIIIPSMLRQVFSMGNYSPVSYVYDNDVLVKNGVIRYTKEMA